MTYTPRLFFKKRLNKTILNPTVAKHWPLGRNIIGKHTVPPWGDIKANGVAIFGRRDFPFEVLVIAGRNVLNLCHILTPKLKSEAAQ